MEQQYLQNKKKLLLENLQAEVGSEKAEVLVEAIMKDCRANEIGYVPLTILELSSIHAALGATLESMRAKFVEGMKRQQGQGPSLSPTFPHSKNALTTNTEKGGDHA